MRIILENFGQWDNLLLMSCFFGPRTTLRGTPLAQDLCGIPRCGVCVSLLCCGVVCRCGVCSKIFVGACKNLGAPPTPLGRTPLPTPLPSAGPPSAGPPKISRFFSLSRHNFHSSLPLLWSFRGILAGVSHDQTCTFEGPGLYSHQTKQPPREEENMKMGGGRGKKKREILGPTLRGPNLRAPLFQGLGPHPSEPHFFNVWAPHPSGPPTLRDTSFRGPSAGPPLHRTALTVSGLLFVLFCS